MAVSAFASDPSADSGKISPRTIRARKPIPYGAPRLRIRMGRLPVKVREGPRGIDLDVVYEPRNESLLEGLAQTLEQQDVARFVVVPDRDPGSGTDLDVPAVDVGVGQGERRGLEEDRQLRPHRDDGLHRDVRTLLLGKGFVSLQGLEAGEGRCHAHHYEAGLALETGGQSLSPDIAPPRENFPRRSL